MARAIMACIARTCPNCGTENRVVASAADIRSNWKINCSHCRTPLLERRGDGEPQPCTAICEGETVSRIPV